MNTQLVVAKYQEDISWVHDATCPVLIYDKDPSPERPTWSHVAYVNLPNVLNGREAHTYLTHIIDNYERLADVTFFVQGNPFAHYPWWSMILESEIHETTPLSDYRPENIPPICKNDTSFHWRSAPLPCQLGIRWLDSWWADRWSSAFATRRRPKALVFSSGAQFAVPKHRITQHSLSYYKYLMYQIKKEPCILDAWLLECFWLYIFGDPFMNGFPDRILQWRFPRMT